MCSTGLRLRAVRREEDQRHVDWHPENESRAWEREIDGKLLLETTNKTLSHLKSLHSIKNCRISNVVSGL